MATGKTKMGSGKNAMVLLSAVVASLLASSAAFAAMPEKKIVLYGWDTGEASLETVLSNADKFADTGLDGISLAIKGNRAGIPRKSQTRDFAFVDPKWTKAEFAKQIGLLREITAKPGLRHCYLQVDWSQKPRLRWSDDEAWDRAAHNMGILAWIAKEGRLDGFFIDHEDYSGTRQFEPCPEEGDFATVSRLARRRGAQIVAAMAEENPNLHLVFFWLLSHSTRWIGDPESDLAAIVAQRQDPWPAFVNGMLDALPPQMRLADGNEFGYLFRADNNDYIMDNWRQRQMLVQLVAPENLMKFRSNVQVSSGHYLDCYSNKDGHWYHPPLNGSRLARLEDNLHQGLASADETIWLFGERRQIVRWDGNAARWNGVKTWEEELPGFADVMRRLRSPRKWAEEKLAAKRKDRTLVNIAANEKAFSVWKGADCTGTLTVEQADGKVALCATGVKKSGCFLVGVPNVKVGQWYSIGFDVKGEIDPRCGVQWQNRGAYDWNVPARYPVFKPLQDGWRRGTISVRVPHGVDRMMLHLSPRHKSAEEKTHFANVAIYGLAD
ncbi:MAG: hypothetical protein IKF72_06045 [Kiritimatiellae bacterium]|nr:hypothetical protein [Kiritimatiellia bacterium]